MIADGKLATLLERFEALEDPFLSWGVVGTALSEGDVDAIVECWLAETGSFDDPLTVIDELVGAGLLVKVEGGYRTRVGEFLWEVANLRQLFPKRDDPEGPPRAWRSAPTLVDGVRFTRRPREYPKRDRDAQVLMERLTAPGSAEREVFRALTSREGGGALALAGFQERATETILSATQGGRSTGAIVGAGTGSGKTLAFYLPAFTRMAGTLDDGHHLRTLALYPRNELLKDQLQSGLGHALRSAAVLRQQAGRPIRVGALFGDVPRTVEALARDWHRSWRRRGSRRVCPYLVCPGAGDSGCGGELSVDTTDRSDEPELRCERCRTVLPADVFALTREQMRRSPPDLLYCSTEMLNRSLLDPATGHVVGLDTSRGPELVLLDEVHTYGGTSGAMTALTLRRWRHRVPSRPVFVGLSATLLDAPRFFGDLIGLRADQVVDIRPDPDELVPEGAEYHLVLRGDPTSGAGLLSTTIQTSMLLGRVMDESRDGRSEGLFGKKAFVFTDDLDVTNRLYFALLDAEGQRHRSGGAFAYKPSLAHLRSGAHEEIVARRRAGQVWDLALATGHKLGSTDRLRVARTSSQDVGLDPDAQLVVATASLEVGVDDPGVGGVLQHKAPRESAAFLQRRGRAGRIRGTRPLTVVVLSDYGRDRETFEAWDQLLSPLLRPSSLPVHNAHVLRMQSVLTALEWAASRCRQVVGRVNLWSVLSGPARNDRQRAAQQSISDELRAALVDEQARNDLSEYLQSALGIDRSRAQALLWEPPRPLLLGAIPSLLRRTHDGWAVAHANELSAVEEDDGARQPLPEFVPPTLFSPLALPEVIVQLPVPTAADPTEPPTEPMALVQAMREFVPGRVTKRFAIGHDLDRAWVTVEPGTTTVDVDTYVALFQRDGDIDGVPLLRPLRITTQRPSDELADSSNGRPNWTSAVRPKAPGVALTVPDTDPLAAHVDSLEAFLHRDQRQVEVLRGVCSADVSLLFKDGREDRSLVALTREDHPVLLGGAFDVDALRLRVRCDVPDAVWSGPFAPELRTSLFRDRLTARLSVLVNPFLAGWLHDVVNNALLSEAIRTERSLQESWTTIREDLAGSLDATLELLFAVRTLDLGEGDAAESPRKLRDRLEAALASPDVLEELDDLVPSLWRPPDQDAREWLRRRIIRTVGELIVKGAALLCPEHDPEGIVLDLTGEFGREEVWISEQVVGGGGFLEAVVDACAAEPDRIFRLARASLRSSAQEFVAATLEGVVPHLVTDGPLTRSFSRYRDAGDASERADALHGLREALKSAGFTVTPDVVGAVVNRLLRVGSSQQTDEVIADSLHRWVDAEKRLGIEVPVRTWSFLDSSSAGVLDVDRLGRLQTVLWPRGGALRNHRFASYNPFASEPAPAPSVLGSLLASQTTDVVSVEDVGEAWAEAQAALQRDGSVRLWSDDSHRAALLDVVARTATETVELEHLRVHSRVTEIIARDTGGTEATIELPLLGRWRIAPGGAGGGAERTRRIMTSGHGRMSEIEQLHHLFFLMELLDPSRPLWIVSAWLSDVAVVDNRGGELFAVAPGLPARRLGIVEVLTEFVSKGGDARVIVRQDDHNRTVVGRLQQLARRTTAGSIHVEMRPELHDKVLVGERLLIEGSMNLTHRGATRNEEGVRVVTERADIAIQRRELERRFGGQGR